MKKQQQLILLALGAGLTYYFLVYLPEEEKKERERQRLIDEENQRQEQQRQQSINEEEENQRKQEAERIKKQENIKNKKLHWRREPKSWADRWLESNKDTFEEALGELGGEERINVFNVSAPYTIHFPPSLWSELNEEQQSFSKGRQLLLDDETKSFKFNEDINKWYDKVLYNPTRGEPDNEGLDNNALFYDAGVGGTGKTSIVRKLIYESNLYPMIEIKGSTLTPNKRDSDIKITPLSKFVFTICDIENTLEDIYGFQREANGEIRYTLFVDECDKVCTTTLIEEYTRLTFLKDIMEGIDKNEQSKNLWIFATNHLARVDPAVYREGRLSNPLDFSWTLGHFIEEYAEPAGIVNEFPEHWLDKPVLNDEDNKWVNMFNKKKFARFFLPFWDKFIHNSETQKKLLEIKPEDATLEYPAQKGIQWGEFFEFFWVLQKSGQLKYFDGKFETPRDPKVEQVLTKTNEALDTRLKEIWEQATKIREEIELTREQGGSMLEGTVNDLLTAVNQIKNKLNM